MFNDFTFKNPRESACEHKRRGSVDLDPLFIKVSRDYTLKSSDSSYPKIDLDDVTRTEQAYERKLSSASTQPSTGWISTSSKSGIQYSFVPLFPPTSVELLKKYSTR